MNVNEYARLQRRATNPLMYRPVLRARDLTYAATLQYLRDEDVPDDLTIPLPRDFPIEALTGEIKRIVHDIRMEGEPITAATRRDTRVVETARKAIEGPILYQAKQPARETVQAMGEDEDHESIGWARVLVGAESCAFCAMLASRGPDYKSRETAIGRGGNPLDAYHTPYLNKNGKLVGGVCDCEAVLVTDFQWEGRQAWGKLEDLWQATGGKQSNRAARNAFRRSWDKKVRGRSPGRRWSPRGRAVAAVGEDEEQPHYRWARVLVGAYSCSFCAMLASRGAVYDSKQAAEVPGGSGLGAYHAPYLNKNGKEVGGLCDCQAVLVVDGKPWEGQAAQKKLNQLWKDHGQGQADPLNAFRRECERQVRARRDPAVPATLGADAGGVTYMRVTTALGVGDASDLRRPATLPAYLLGVFTGSELFGYGELVGSLPATDSG